MSSSEALLKDNLSSLRNDIFFKFAMFILTWTGMKPMVVFNRFNSLRNCFIADRVCIDRDDLYKVALFLRKDCSMVIQVVCMSHGKHFLSNSAKLVFMCKVTYRMKLDCQSECEPRTRYLTLTDVKWGVILYAHTRDAEGNPKVKTSR